MQQVEFPFDPEDQGTTLVKRFEALVSLSEKLAQVRSLPCRWMLLTIALAALAGWDMSGGHDIAIFSVSPVRVGPDFEVARNRQGGRRGGGDLRD